MSPEGVPMDLRDLSDEDLDAHRRDVAAEQERRTNLEAIPAQVADLAAKYTDGGGNPDDLRDILG